jgi:hypothetical protein
MQVLKMRMRSFMVWVIAMVVVVVSQKAMIPGLRRLIKKPEATNFAWVPADTFIESSSALLSFSFLKNNNTHPYLSTAAS